MISIREKIFIKFADGVSIYRMELEVDAASELPEPDFIEGILLYQGSIAHDISTGDFYAINSTGTWYNQDGSGAYVPDETEPDALNSKLNHLDIKDVPVELTEEHDSEGTGEIMEEIPETEALESKEVTEDAEPLRNSESE